MKPPDPITTISMLTKRHRVLRAVGTNGCDKRTLTESLSVSRSTVDRSIRELETAGLLTRSPAGYQRTLLGELLLSEYDAFESRTSDLLSAEPLLSTLPPETDIDPIVFEGASTVTASRHAPHQPISALCSLLREARWIQMVMPAVFPQVVDTCIQSTETGALRADIVVTDPVVSTLIGSHTESLQGLLAAQRIAVHTVPTASEYVLLIAEQESGATGGLLVLDDGGARALISTETQAAVSWIRDQIDYQLNQSSPLSSLSAHSSPDQS